MNSQRTDSILQRVPVILAVTAASYGLMQQARPEPCRRVMRNGPLGEPRLRRGRLTKDDSIGALAR